MVLGGKTKRRHRLQGFLPITEKMNLSALNLNRELDMEQILRQFGNTLLGQVFATYYNSTVDSQLAALTAKDLGTEAQSRTVYSEVRERYKQPSAVQTGFLFLHAKLCGPEQGLLRFLRVWGKG